jgi:hypothetical protein
MLLASTARREEVQCLDDGIALRHDVAHHFAACAGQLRREESSASGHPSGFFNRNSRLRQDPAFVDSWMESWTSTWTLQPNQSVAQTRIMGVQETPSRDHPPGRRPPMLFDRQESVF